MERNPENNLPHHESVYGGSMSAYEFYQSEFEICEDEPQWVFPDVLGFKANFDGKQVVLTRCNTRVYDFSEIEGEDGVIRDFSWMSHILMFNDEGNMCYRRPEHDEIEQARWDAMANKLIDIDCDYISGLPRKWDFDMMHRIMRGELSMDEIIEMIQNETPTP